MCACLCEMERTRDKSEGGYTVSGGMNERTSIYAGSDQQHGTVDQETKNGKE